MKSLNLKPRILAALCAVASTGALAAAPVFLTIDRSSESLINAAAAQAIWQQELAKAGVVRLAKLYPTSRWGFLSQVQGGYNSAKICVVTARVALLPRSGKTLVFTPNKMATAFDAVPNIPQEQCQALAKAKLEEAISAVMSSLIVPR